MFACMHVDMFTCICVLVSVSVFACVSACVFACERKRESECVYVRPGVHACAEHVGACICMHSYMLQSYIHYHTQLGTVLLHTPLTGPKTQRHMTRDNDQQLNPKCVLVLQQ